MRIAIVTNSSWNIYNFRMGLIHQLQKEGFEIIAIAPEDEFSDKLRQQIPFYPIEISSKGTNPFKDLSLVANFYKIYKQTKADYILHYTIKPNIYGTIAAKLAGIPSVNTVSGLGTVFLHDNLVSKVAIALYKIAFRHSGKVVFQNKYDQQLFLQKKIVKEEKTVLVSGSGVNLEKFNYSGFQNTKPFKFLMFARLLFDKGICEYIDAVRIVKKRLPETEFLLAGSFDEAGKLGISRDILADWEKEGLIQFHGFSEDVRQLIESVNCVVLPSYREGTPKSLLEAAAMGKPLIATEVPGCTEVVFDHENGLLCRVRDAEDLAQKMLQMIEFPDEKLEEMASKSRRLAESVFSEEKVAKQYLNIIRNM